MNEKPLYIPTNVPDNNDLISGFGTKELAITGIGVAVAVTVAVFLFGVTGNIVNAILIPFGGVAVLVVCIRRDQFSESLIDKLRYVWIYYHAQRVYQYQYYDYIEEMMSIREKEEQKNDGE